VPLEVSGPGLLDCHLYRQPGRLILHVANLTNEASCRAPIEELIPVGPLRVRVKLDADLRGNRAECLVMGRRLAVGMKQGWAEFEIPRVEDHEVIVLE
jgi:hypothetical protein